MKCDAFKCPREAVWVITPHKENDKYITNVFCDEYANKIPEHGILMKRKIKGKSTLT